MTQAVVIIHGIGEQRPGDTVRSFVRAVADGTIRSKPDRLDESFELRRYTLRQGRRLRVDFYELYWAHQIGSASWRSTLRWLRRLLVRLPRSVPSALRPMYATFWGAIVLAAAAVGLIMQQVSPGGVAPILAAVVAYGALTLAIARFVSSRFVLGFVGDAARYLTPEPENIEARVRVRANAIKLLRKLHDDGQYSRIIVVGHSLGSVIGYEVLRHLWDERRHPQSDVPIPQPEAKKFRMAVAAVNTPGHEVSAAQAVTDFQQQQLALWREQRALGTSWLVTDFVTLGSPLAHAELLLEHRDISLNERQSDFELPTCPPCSAGGKEGWSYLDKRMVDDRGTRRPHDFRVANHGAVFSSTRWTNLYFPYRRLVFGDIIGGPLRDVFGKGIRDMPVHPSCPGRLARTLASHVTYWKMPPDGEDHQLREEARDVEEQPPSTKDAIGALRSALALQRWKLRP